MIEFLYPQAFLLLILPWLLRFWLSPAKGLHGDALRVPFFGDISQINIRSGSARRMRTGHNDSSFLLLLLVWMFLSIAASRPQFVGNPVQIKDYGRDILLVMDISTSMQEADFSLNNRRIDRLTAVKAAADNFVAQRPNDRFGVILFGTRAYLQAPITADKTAVREILRSMDAGMAGNSTAIGDAVGLALKNLKDRGDKDEKVIILLTDGENNDGSLSMPQAISLAKNEKIKIYTIGVGNADSFISSFFGVKVAAPRMEIDEVSLKKLAEETKGNYFRATDTQSLQNIYNEINKLEPSENEDQYVAEVKELYYIPLAVAFVIAGLLLALQRRRK